MNSRPRIGPRLWVAIGAAAFAAVAVGFTPHPAAAALSTGVVDVTTTLGLQNGAAAGTGMVLTASGEILTNNHVIDGATDMRVIDPSTGRSYTATVVGYSVTNDVAVLQVNGTVHLHPIARGNSANVKVGCGFRWAAFRPVWWPYRSRYVAAAKLGRHGTATVG
jgi:S1-C subfamily serine protease